MAKAIQFAYYQKTSSAPQGGVENGDLAVWGYVAGGDNADPLIHDDVAEGGQGFLVSWLQASRVQCHAAKVQAGFRRVAHAGFFEIPCAEPLAAGFL